MVQLDSRRTPETYITCDLLQRVPVPLPPSSTLSPGVIRVLRTPFGTPAPFPKPSPGIPRALPPRGGRQRMGSGADE